ncbi:class I SAM-dependent methyltransferase [Burkholderia gladioli]|uniref:class I SAM-dependent methyltransferase n=1 Tax=Burkholderia gladioli TaxID=28095 RepID=UPI00163FC0FC|nr:class I SAM-dependent methyltransferase [Burkholderia gladioli]
MTSVLGDSSMSKELQMLEDRALSPHQEAVLFEALKKIYPAGFEEQPQAEETFEVEIHTRSYWFRKRYIPWIGSFTSLKNQKILEIGAGTGTSAIPLAEQGAYVFSIDINAAGLEVARIRSRLHGLDHLTDFNLGNAEEVGETFKGKQFDMVVYFASLEHMTYSERIQTLQAAWLLLSPGGHLVVVDSPNRLWYFDEHTSFTNFFHWLPNDVAIDYAKHTGREGFNKEFDVAVSDADVRLARWGRGISIHDFQIAIGPVESCPVEQLWTSGEWDYRRGTQPEWATWQATTLAGRYHALMQEICPRLPSAWLESEIAIALRKPMR